MTAIHSAPPAGSRSRALSSPCAWFGAKPAPEDAELRLNGPMVANRSSARERVNCPLALPE
jgi:hypothetical protein